MSKTCQKCFIIHLLRKILQNGLKSKQMKSLSQYIKEALKVTSKSKVNTYNYHPKTRDELKELVNKLIEERGNEADLNDIDTSKIKDMVSMFEHSKFNGDISKWDVSNVKDMRFIFDKSPLKKNPPKWFI